jgi:hypothetical protein
MSSNLMRMTRITPFESDNEGRYYSLWCSNTVYEVLPYCQYSLHCSMLYGACTQASIRHAVIALAALHEASMAAKHARSQSFDHLGLVATRHHRNAIEHYGKSIHIMRRAIASGDQDIRSTLVACFITFGFEAFHGDLALSVAQIRSGIALIEDWKKNYLFHGGVEPDDEVIGTFLCLEIQIISFLDRRPLENHAESRTAYVDRLRSMARPFSSMWEATKYFYIVIKHQEHFLHLAKGLLKRCQELGEEHAAEREKLYNEVKSYQAHHIAELDQWKASYYPLIANIDFSSNVGHDEDTIARAMYIRLHLIHSTTVLETVFATDEAIYDKYTTEFSMMVSDAAELKGLTEYKSMSTNWTFDLSAVLPLYFIATKCRVRRIRNQALENLNRGPRREGIWDNLLIRNMVAWIQSIEEEFCGGISEVY